MARKPSAGTDLNLLPLFVAIYEKRNLTLAAGRLQMSQSALSQALKKLRQSIGDRLFERRGGEFVPTERAHRLYREIPGLLEALHQNLDGARRDSDNLPSPLVIATDIWLQDRLVSALIDALDKSLHQMEVQLLPLTDDDFPKLKEGKIHMILTAPPPNAGTMTGLDVLALQDEDWVCALRPGHPMAKNDYISLADYLLLTHLTVAGASEGVLHRIRKMSQRQISRLDVTDLSATAALMQTDLAFTCPQSFALAKGWVCLRLPFDLGTRSMALYRRPSLPAGSGSPMDGLHRLAMRLAGLLGK